MASWQPDRAKTPGLSETEVLEQLADRGGDPPSERQMRRLRTLLPRVPGLSEGRPGRPRVLYRPDAVDWVEAVMAMRSGEHLPPQHVLGFELWWQGFDVATADARRYLKRVIAERMPDLRPTGELEEDVEAVMQPIAEKRVRDPTFDFLTERADGNKALVVEALYALLTLVLGGDPGFDDRHQYAGAGDADEPGPREALNRTLGFERAQQDALPNAEPLFGEGVDLEQFLDQLGIAKFASADGLASLIDSASDDQLGQALDDGRLFTDDLRFLAAAVERDRGVDFSGFGTFTIERGEVGDRWGRAAAVPTMLLLRNALGDPLVDDFKSLVREKKVAAQTYNAVIQRFPQYADLIKDGNDELREQAPPELLAKATAEIRAFIESTPGLEMPKIPDT